MQEEEEVVEEEEEEEEYEEKYTIKYLSYCMTHTRKSKSNFLESYASVFFIQRGNYFFSLFMLVNITM